MGLFGFLFGFAHHALMFIVFFSFLLDCLYKHFLGDMLLTSALLNSCSYGLPDVIDHRIFVIGISFEHVIDLRLWHNILYFAEIIFSHGSVSLVKALDGLDIGCDKLIK